MSNYINYTAKCKDSSNCPFAISVLRGWNKPTFSRVIWAPGIKKKKKKKKNMRGLHFFFF